MPDAANGGGASPGEPHISQCEAVCGAPLPLVSPASALPDAAKFRLQTPPSLPLRTSWASMETGASKADKTARKLSHAATRVHQDGLGREYERWLITA